MNLKEAYRYQGFLDRMLQQCAVKAADRRNALITTRTHKRHAANPDAEDIVEQEDRSGCYDPAGILDLMQRLTAARKDLSEAISAAKQASREAGFDMDAALEEAKFARATARAARSFLEFKASRTVSRGKDYKFNVEGNQTEYSYEIESDAAENFDRAKVKGLSKDLLKAADELSARIEEAQINAQVAFDAPWDVNDGFDDLMPAKEAPAEG